MIRLFVLIVAWGLSALASARPDETVFARIDGNVITQAELDAAVYLERRRRFYHGRLSDERLTALRRDVAGAMIDRLLLVKEARRRGLVAATADIESEIERKIQQFNTEALPDDHRQQFLTELSRQVEQDLLLKQLEQKIKQVGRPGEQALKAYYEANAEKFTTPVRLHVSVILLKVSPSAPVEAWQAAEREARQLYRKLKEGADFAQLARLHSGDASAENGGDLGFVHEGMLSQEAQQAVDSLAEGRISEPVVLLQGVALFRVNARSAAKLNPMAQVRERAEGLWRRESEERAWQLFLQELRSKAEIEILDEVVTAADLWEGEPAAAR